IQMLKLRLICTSDLHVHVRPYDYFRDVPDETLGLAALAPLIEQARAEVANALLFDNGDFIQGSPLGDVVAAGHERGEAFDHPMLAAMNLMRYDAGTIGNHEFNYGLGFLASCLSQATFPIVNANLATTDGAPYAAPWRILERTLVTEAGEPLTFRIGVIGFVPPQVMQWDRAHLDGRIAAEDIVEAARREVPLLREAGADIVVALCHSGIAGGPYRPGQENAARELARVDGIDALVTGHQHLLFPGSPEFDVIEGVDNLRGSLHGQPAVMPCCFATAFGIIDLALEHGASGWKVADFAIDIRRLGEGDPADATIREAILTQTQDNHALTLNYVRERVGETTVGIDSFFSLVGDSAAVKVVADAQLEEARELLQGSEYAGLPLLSAAAPFKAGGRGGPLYYTKVDPGPLTMRDLANLYLYPNTVSVVRVTGAVLREWLERSAGIFRHISPEKTGEQVLVQNTFPSYHFDVISGVTYRIDPTKPARHDRDGVLVAPDAHRIVDLRFEGAPVRDDQIFLVATNNYRAGGGGTFFGDEPPDVVVSSTYLVRDSIMRYVARRKCISPGREGSWRFVPLPESANVIFLTGRDARGLEPPGVLLDHLGETDQGFVKYRLRGYAE
ncbi:MAG TPA: bifunctional 2',3'-cyclic-nucleotide 2'-phosphodiesterase/3'-nucleotidase, partial [Saliniramus sp.]|nr:bifunctional 2',3'-cyclic-nucleotide 2'-phosphodiesterase/3'-nucleotidase [Saliniramus sp.]